MPDLSQAGFSKTQYQFAAHIRDPEHSDFPPGIEDRRMKIYRDLFYNNIESFLSSGFPILHSVLAEDYWHSLVREFISQHQSETPYFLEISQEFLRFLQEEHKATANDPVFMLELAHYEWVELALDVSAEDFPFDKRAGLNLLNDIPVVSPLAWRLSYQYPVHTIGPENQPTEPPEQPTFLVVYRNRQNQVKFLAANAVTIRLLQLLEETMVSGEQALRTIAGELQSPNPEQIVASGQDLLEKLLRLDIIL